MGNVDLPGRKERRPRPAAIELLAEVAPKSPETARCLRAIAVSQEVRKWVLGTLGAGTATAILKKLGWLLTLVGAHYRPK